MLTLSELAEFLRTSLPDEKIEMIGDPDHSLTRVASVASADPACVSFYSDARLIHQLTECRAGALILDNQSIGSFSGNKIVAANPLLAFTIAIDKFHEPAVVEPGEHSSAVIDPSARIGENVTLGANVVVGAHTEIGDHVRIEANTVVGDNCQIGEATKLDSHVVIYENCFIGARCRISAGVVIGSQGFGYVREAGRWRPVPQIGGVRIGNDVDIGAQTTIDCGALDPTVIEDRVKIDNQVLIGHNCRVGEDTIMAGYCGMSGSSTVGKRCMLGGRVSITDHITIADDVILEGTTFASRSIANAGRYSSIVTAQEASVWKRNSARLHRLDGLAKRVRTLEKKLAASDN